MAKRQKKSAAASKVLIADDTETMRNILRGLLKGCGFLKIQECKDGKQALNELKKETYDLILCDWEMPGPQGDEILKEVRQSNNNADSIFIMCTGVNNPELVKEAIKGGVSNYIVKPLSQNVINEKLALYFSF